MKRKEFHGKQKVKLKRIIAYLKREYLHFKDPLIIKELDKYHKLLYHTSFKTSWFCRKKTV